MIPTKTGAAVAVGLVLPHLNGRLDGMAVRIPTINVSLVDLTCRLKNDASTDEVNHAIQKAATENPGGILTTNSLPLVSQDFNHNPASSIVDLNHTKVLGGLTKFCRGTTTSGVSNRMLDTTISWMIQKTSKQSAAPALVAIFGRDNPPFFWTYFAKHISHINSVPNPRTLSQTWAGRPLDGYGRWNPRCIDYRKK